jgi:N2227-like protein
MKLVAYDVSGGVWINLGPLLYHYADIPGENSIEPTYEMVKEIIQDVGFVMEVNFKFWKTFLRFSNWHYLHLTNSCFISLIELQEILTFHSTFFLIRRNY